MEGVLQFLNQGWLSLVFTAVMTYVGYWLGSRRARPRALIEASHELTWSGSSTIPEGFEVRFSGQPVPRIARGVCRFWNGGSGTLLGDEVAHNDRLRLTIPDGEFLAFGLITQSSAANSCAVERDPADPRSLYLSFEFLDANQGLMVFFLHTSTGAVPRLAGTVRGHRISVVERRRGPQSVVERVRKLRRFTKHAPLAAAVVGVVAMMLALIPAPFSQFPALDKSATTLIPVRVLLASVGVLYLGLGGFAYWIGRKPYPKALNMPRKPEGGGNP